MAVPFNSHEGLKGKQRHNRHEVGTGKALKIVSGIAVLAAFIGYLGLNQYMNPKLGAEETSRNPGKQIWFKGN